MTHTRRIIYNSLAQLGVFAGFCVNVVLGYSPWFNALLFLCSAYFCATLAFLTSDRAFRWLLRFCWAWSKRAEPKSRASIAVTIDRAYTSRRLISMKRGPEAFFAMAAAHRAFREEAGFTPEYYKHAKLKQESDRAVFVPLDIAMRARQEGGWPLNEHQLDALKIRGTRTFRVFPSRQMGKTAAFAGNAQLQAEAAEILEPDDARMVGHSPHERIVDPDRCYCMDALNVVCPHHQEVARD